MTTIETDSATARRVPSTASRVVLGSVLVAWYLPAIASVGLRTDVGAHEKFGEAMSLTGRPPGPYYLFEQALIVVRAIIPFDLLGRISTSWGSRSATWDVSALVVLLVAVVVLGDLVYRRLVGSFDTGRVRIDRGWSGIATFGLLVVAPITVLTWGHHELLVGYISTTTYENPTGILVRPIALALFWAYLDRVGERNTLRAMLPCAALMVLSLHAKPSFAVVFVPASAITMAWAVIRRRADDWRLWLLGVLLPFAIVTAIQIAATSDQGAGIAFRPFRVVRMLLALRDQPLWMFAPLLLASIVFPLVVTASYWSEAVRSRSLVLAWVTFGVGVASFCTLQFTGRFDYGDFVWGPQLALFVLFVESVRLVLPRLATRWQGPASDRRRLDRRSRLVILAFAAHVACGVLLHHQEIVNPAAWW
ncbi:MAG: hypothetical protein U0Q22_02645 [Acidimicrobiales bacterium]